MDFAVCSSLQDPRLRCYVVCAHLLLRDHSNRQPRTSQLTSFSSLLFFPVAVRRCAPVSVVGVSSDTPDHASSHTPALRPSSPPKSPKIHDIEKGYYADGEDAYDMRLKFPHKEPTYGSMTPLKQVVSVKRKEEGESAQAPAAEGGAAAAAAGAAGKSEAGTGAVDEVAEKMEELSVGAASAGKA